MAKCFNCGTELTVRDEFCPVCGVDVIRGSDSQVLMVCSECGQPFKIPSGSKETLCGACKGRRESKAQTHHDRHQEEKKKKESSMRALTAEERAAIRFEVAKCFVRVYKRGLTSLIFRSKPNTGPLIDLSRTGLQCVAEGDFDHDDEVTVSLLVPAFANPLSLKGVVRWVRDSGPGRVRLGIEFSASDEKTQAHLTALEKHQALREAAYIKEKKPSSRRVKKSSEGKPPADF